MRLDFTEVVRQHQAMVFSLAYHFLRDRATAEEVAQEVFLHLHQKAGELESEAHVTFWLRKVTSHRCIDESRRRRLRPRLTLADVPEPPSTDPQRDPMLSATLQKLVATLPEKPRMVVLLRYQEDLERELRMALRRKEPARDLAQWWSARGRRGRRSQSWGLLAVAAGVAAMLLIPAAAIEYQRYERHQAEGRAAKEKLVQAFHRAGTTVQRTKKMLRERSL